MTEGDTMQLDAPVELDETVSPFGEVQEEPTLDPGPPLASSDEEQELDDPDVIREAPPVQSAPLPEETAAPMEEEPTSSIKPPKRAPSAPTEEESQDPIYLLMLETIGRMTSCYDEGDLPPAVAQIQDLVSARDYETIRSDFNKMWTDLVQYHRDRGIQLQPRVSHNFRTIDTIVRNL